MTFDPINDWVKPLGIIGPKFHWNPSKHVCIASQNTGLTMLTTHTQPHIHTHTHPHTHPHIRSPFHSPLLELNSFGGYNNHSISTATCHTAPAIDWTIDLTAWPHEFTVAWGALLCLYNWSTQARACASCDVASTSVHNNYTHQQINAQWSHETLPIFFLS